MDRALPKIFFGGYAIAAFVTAATDVFFAETLAGRSAWGFAPGWMREIAALDVFLGVLCVLCLRNLDDARMPRACASALALLSVLIASNNFAAWWTTGLALHLQGAGIHVIAAAAAAGSALVLGHRAG